MLRERGVIVRRQDGLRRERMVGTSMVLKAATRASAVWRWRVWAMVGFLQGDGFARGEFSRTFSFTTIAGMCSITKAEIIYTNLRKIKRLNYKCTADLSYNVRIY